MTMVSARISSLDENACRALENNGTLGAACQDIALEIQSGRTKVHSVIEELGPCLTNTDVAARTIGVKILSVILSNLGEDYLNETELQLLTDFYCDRLQDHHSIGPATITGILAIIRMNHLPSDAPLRLLHGIFQNIRCQSELQETRRNIYLIFQKLLETHVDQLKAMGPDFVYGVISQMDGECDPRNLMLLFNFLPTFIETFPLGHLTEEMFEVVACYFPIDFNANGITGEKKKINRDDLAEALAPCLYATPHFAEFCVPHAMEKLGSDRKIAKVDSLNLLAKGAPIFGSKGLKNHLDELWPMCRKEVMSGGDQAVRNAALTAVSNIIKSLADDEEVRQSFVKRIFDDTRWSLCDVQLSLYWPAEKLLETVGATGKTSCVQVLRDFIPLCLRQYSTKTSITNKGALLETLNNFIRVSGDFHFTLGDIPELAWTDIPGLYLDELVTGDKSLKIHSLSGLVIQKSSLEESQRGIVYENISDLIETDIVGELKNICHSTLLDFAQLYPNEVLDVVKKRLQFHGDNLDWNLLARRLEAVSILAKIREIGIAVLPQILDIATASDPRTDIKALSCMLQLLSSPNNNFNIHSYLYQECNAIERLMSCERNESFQKLALVSSVCRAIIQKLSVDHQQAVVDKYVSIPDCGISDSKSLLFEGLLTALRQNVQIENIEGLLAEFFKLAINSVAPTAIRSSCRIIAVLINKMKEETSFEKSVNYLRDQIINIFESDDIAMRTKKSAITLHTWLTKSLVTKGSGNSQDFLVYQINIVRMKTIGDLALEEFKTLVDNSENTLTRGNFCTIKIFYKQRIFQNVIEMNRQFDGKSRKNYLVALTHLVEQLPIELPIMHLEMLVPLLVEALSLDDGQLLMSSLKTLEDLLETKHEIFIDQIQCFIPRCLQLSTCNRMNVRILAMNCLMSYCNYPVVELLKHKQDVLDKLGDAVGDQKRLVRQIAVKAITRWYLVGAHGTPD